MNTATYRTTRNNNINTLLPQSSSRRSSSKSPSQQKIQIVDSKIYTLNSGRSPFKSSDYLPPRAGPFQRTNRSRSKDNSIRDKSHSSISNLTIEKELEGNKDSRVRT